MVFCFCGLVHHRISQSEVGADRRRDADIPVSEKHLHRTSLVEAAGQTGSGADESAGRNWDRGRLSSCFGNGKKRVYDAGRTLSGGRNAEEAGIFFETLKDYSGAGEDGEYGSTLFYVMEYMDEEAHIFFLMGLDWKREVETLEWRIESALTKISACLPTCRISEHMETSQFPPLLFCRL